MPVTIEQLNALWHLVMPVVPLEKLMIAIKIVELSQHSVFGSVSSLADIGNGFGEEEVEDRVVLVELQAVDRGRLVSVGAHRLPD